MLDDMDCALEAVLCGAGLGYLYYEQVKEHLISGKPAQVFDERQPERPSPQLYSAIKVKFETRRKYPAGMIYGN
ncbi:hypothetical protein [Acerihabitans arboris]|uniref:hypothetical protein n=1 Tax=Acerihabitans arboris TaxID=2691583 RepID=UPI001FEA2361|nr:hypothetical protein [Acerihabitans arboris]